MKRSEILSNRKIVVEFLQQPERKKALYRLDRGDGHRCCIGHMCYALELPSEVDTKPEAAGCINYCGEIGYAPSELIDKLGLYYSDGSSGNHSFVQGKESLAILNDSSSCTTQDIGAYLESVIKGGKHTPWKPLDEYPE